MSQALDAFTPSARFNAEQAANLRVVLSTYRSYRLNAAMTLAAVANAWAESRLRNDAANYSLRADGTVAEWSVGLFQLKVPNGAGDVLNPPGPVIPVGARPNEKGRVEGARPAWNDLRRDPLLNTRALIEQELVPGKGRYADRMLAMSDSPGVTLLDLALDFGRYVERHRWDAEHIRVRSAAYREILGAWADRTVQSINGTEATAQTGGGGAVAVKPPALPVFTVERRQQAKRAGSMLGIVALGALMLYAAVWGVFRAPIAGSLTDGGGPSGG